ncbi:hypothetical protein L208DRAFT_1269257, partial [Tricholoma matsutake]
KEHDGQVHVVTNTWTSTNHHAFVAWTIHLHHQGKILSSWTLLKFLRSVIYFSLKCPLTHSFFWTASLIQGRPLLKHFTRC